MAGEPYYLQVLRKRASVSGSFSANVIMKILEYPVMREEGKVEE